MTETPRRRLAANALLRNQRGEILLVQPTYRADDLWLLVGGTVDEDEAPLRACRREVREELGIDVPLRQLLCVEYQPRTARGPASLHFLFDGGVLTEAQVAQLRLPAGELGAWEFVEEGAARRRVGPRVGRRLEVALMALQQRRTIYLEDGVVTGAWPEASQEE
ncbi:MAG TPA: NUDIX hydrolase [Chloroflexota bacterium]|jgi:8-oxo-dGTP diphosphatase|nr:NUDIX hydrolase [Chloroflexota bacterium]